MSGNHVRSENIQTTLSQLVGDFAGRRDMLGYDETRLVHIHRRNRAYVWNKEMREGCLDSILKGYYIPPIICNSIIYGGRERREVMEGGNRITTFKLILEEKVRPLTPEERRIVESYPITVVVMRNLTPSQQRQMFRRLNRNVRVSDGQLFAMSIEDSPLVAEAHAFLNDDAYPLRESMTRLFFDSRLPDSAAQNNLSNAVALVSGAVHGVSYITRSFNVQEVMVEDQTPIVRAHVVSILGKVFEVFNMANRTHPLTDKRRMKGQFNVGKWLGAILYDILMNPDNTREVQDKWADYIVRIREDLRAEEASSIKGAQNLNPDHLKRISTKVEIYLRDQRFATDAEIKAVYHPRSQDQDDESEIDSEEAYEEGSVEN